MRIRSFASLTAFPMRGAATLASLVVIAAGAVLTFASPSANTAVAAVQSAQQAAATAISGTVTRPNGAEAGGWVIAVRGSTALSGSSVGRASIRGIQSA